MRSILFYSQLTNNMNFIFMWYLLSTKFLLAKIKVVVPIVRVKQNIALQKTKSVLNTVGVLKILTVFLEIKQ